MSDQPYAVKVRNQGGKWKVASRHYNRVDAGNAASEMLNYAYLRDLDVEIKVVYDPTGVFEEA